MAELVVYDSHQTRTFRDISTYINADLTPIEARAAFEIRCRNLQKQSAKSAQSLHMFTDNATQR